MIRKLSAEISRHTPYSDDNSNAGNSPPSKSSRDISSTGSASPNTTALASAVDGATENCPGNGAPLNPLTYMHTATPAAAATDATASNSAAREYPPIISTASISTMPSSSRCSGSIA